jgi:hypothetical protein
MKNIKVENILLKLIEGKISAPVHALTRERNRRWQTRLGEEFL